MKSKYTVMKKLLPIFVILALPSLCFSQDSRTWTLTTSAPSTPDYISYYNGEFYLYSNDGTISLIDPSIQPGANNPFGSGGASLSGITSYWKLGTCGFSINTRGEYVILTYDHHNIQSKRAASQAMDSCRHIHQ